MEREESRAHEAVVESWEGGVDYSRRRIEGAFLYGYNASWRGNVGSFVSRI